MQTFLPYSNFKRTAEILDYKRLGRQRVESLQILNSIHTGKGWINHPAVRMWIGFEELLKHYMNIMITEWVSRGYNNTMKIEAVNFDRIKKPKWLGLKAFHDSHKSNLLRKDFEHYKKFNWNVDSNIPYWWPVFLDKKTKEWRSKNVS